MKQKTIFAITVGATILGSGLSHAAGLESARLITGWQNADGTHVVGLGLELSQGWKTYWRSPGDAGFPPEFDFSNSQNIKSVEIIWPAPEQFGSEGFETLGYRGRATLPIKITPIHSGSPITVALDANIGICEDICVPVSVSLSNTAQPGQNDRAPEILAALAQAPFGMDELGHPPITCDFAPGADRMNVTITATLPRLGDWERSVVEYMDTVLWAQNTATTRQGDRLIGQAQLIPMTETMAAIDRSRLRISVLGPNTVIEQIGCHSR